MTGRKLQGWAAAGEAVFQQASSNTMHHHTLVFPEPSWVYCCAANAQVVDSGAGSMKQDTLTLGTSSGKSAVIFPTLQCLCTSLTTVMAKVPSLLGALYQKAVWVRQHLLFAVGLWWKQHFSLFYPFAVPSVSAQWNWKIFLFCTVLL